MFDEERNVAYRSTFIVDREGILRWAQAGDREIVRNGAEILRVLGPDHLASSLTGRPEEAVTMHQAGAFLLLCSTAVTLLAGCAVPLPKSRLSLDQYLSLPRPSLVDLARAMETASNVERRDVLKAVLDHRRVPYTVHSYVAGTGTGENFIFEVGEGRRTVIFTAHHDTYPGSPGANDDASCIAAILAAYERLRASPPRNLMVRFIIFDGEERRLEGSRSYAGGRKFDHLIGVYAYELCGIGRRVNLWDVVSEGLKRSEIFTRLVEVLEEGEIPFVVRGGVASGGRAFHSSDHAAFREADPPIPGLAVTILPEGLLAQLKPFDYYHNENDLAVTLEEAAIQTMSELIYRTVRKLSAPRP